MYKLPRKKVIKTLIVILFSESEKKSEEKKSEELMWRDRCDTVMEVKTLRRKKEKCQVPAQP